MRGALADVRLGANGLKTSHQVRKVSRQKQSFVSRRYLFDSSRANYQIPAVGLCACSTEPRSTALPDWCRQGTLMRLITPLTGGACARHDVRKTDGPNHGRPGGPGLAQTTGSRAVSHPDSHCCCRDACFILRIGHRTNQHGKAGSMRAVGDTRYEICPGHPVHSFCLQLARTQRRLLIERKQQRLSCLPRAAVVGRPGR